MRTSQNICPYKNIRFQSKYMRTSWNICAYPKYPLTCEISAHIKNIRAHEIFAPMKCLRPWNVRLYLPPIFAAYICRLCLPPIFAACANILSKRQYFNDFCNEFLLDFCCCKYLCIFSVFIYAFLCAPIFLAQLFWSLGLRLM